MLLALCAGCFHGAPTPRPTLQPPPVATGCRGDAKRADITLDRIDREAPIAIVEEVHLHGHGPASPTIAVWADGEVVFAAGERLHRSEISTTDAAVLAGDAFRALADVPMYTTILDISGGPLLRITVRDGDRWRSAAIFGDGPERVLAVARGTAAPPRPESERPADPLEASTFDLEQRPWAPHGFALAYRRLVENVPRRGVAFEVHDFDITFTTAPPTMQPALEWPGDLPRPALAPEACRVDDDGSGGCRFAFAPSDNDAVRRFERSRRPGTAVRVNGAEYAVSVDGNYRGQRGIDALAACADALAHHE